LFCVLFVLCCSVYFLVCVVLFIVCFVFFCVLFVLCCSVYFLFCVVLCVVCLVLFCVFFGLCCSVYFLVYVVLCIVCLVLFCVFFGLCCSVYCLFCVFLCIVCIVLFCVLFLCKCVLTTATGWQPNCSLTNISYHIMLYQLLSETFLILRRIQRDIATNAHKSFFMQSTLYSCQILNKLEFSRQIFEESSNINFYRNPSSGSQVVAFVRTDGRKDAPKSSPLYVVSLYIPIFLKCNHTTTKDNSLYLELFIIPPFQIALHYPKIAL
jgi:hypothetical protein